MVWQLYEAPNYPSKPRVSKAELRKLYYKDGMTLATIGVKFGVSRERVRQWMEREGLARRSLGGHVQKISPNLWPQVCRDYKKEGYGGLGKVAHKWNVSPGAIGRILRKSGITSQPYKVPMESWDKVCENYLRLGTMVKVSKVWGISYWTVNRILIRMGMPRNPKGWPRRSKER